LVELQNRLFTFLHLADEGYLPVIYHNNVHAADVVLIMHWMLNSNYIQYNMNKLDHFMAIVASAIHDMGHDGVNQNFHTKTLSPLSLRYNDRSVLENMHAARAFELMRGHEDADWFQLLSTEFQSDPSEKAVNLKQYMRKGLLSMVLMTDITKHEHLMNQIEDIAAKAQEAGAFQKRALARGTNFEIQAPGAFDKKLVILEVMLHAADVSNPARPNPLLVQDWTRRIVTEFWHQGDQERHLGLEVSPLCDRVSGFNSVPQSQIGFISFVVKPLFEQVSIVITEVSAAVDALDNSVAFWTSKKEANASFEDLYPGKEKQDPDETTLRQVRKGECPLGHDLFLFLGKDLGSCARCGVAQEKGMPVWNCAMCKWWACTSCAPKCWSWSTIACPKGCVMVPSRIDSGTCSRCSNAADPGKFVFECDTCNAWTCEACARPQERRCECGNVLMTDSEFCRKCGKKWVAKEPR
jgi:hypothetical protein